MEWREVAHHPHDPKAFTQGLEFHGDDLLESTGEYGRSALIRYRAGRTDWRELPRHLFGEGLTVFSGEIWQLTWREGVALVYELESMALLRQLNYSGEGWGLSHDGEFLIMSDGSPRLTWRSAESFQAQRRALVRDGARPVSRINELEWVNDRLLANIWQQDRIAVIDPDTACVTHWLNLTTLWPQRQRPAGTDVMNGIAWHAGSGRLWVTGKRWAHLYELDVPDLRRTRDTSVLETED